MTKAKYKLIIDDLDEIFSKPIEGINFLKELEKYNPDLNIPTQEVALYEINDKKQFCPSLYGSIKEVIVYLQTLK